MIRNWMLAALVLVVPGALPAVAGAAGAGTVVAPDEILLRDGRRLEGEIEARTDTTIELRNRFGRVVLSVAEIERIVPAPSAEQRLSEARSAVDAGEADSWVSFAQWCRAEGFGAQATQALEEAIRLQQDHAGARELLGHRKVGDRWLPFKEAMREQGLVRDSGEWVSAQEAQRRRHERAQRERRRRLQSKVNALARELAARSDSRRDAAREALLAIALAERSPAMGGRVHRLHRQYREWWAGQPEVRLEVRTGLTRLQGIDTLTTSLGSGAPVRIQLPRLRTISLGTTVVVPGG